LDKYYTYGFNSRTKFAEILCKIHFLKHKAVKPRNKSRKSIVKIISSNHQFTSKQIEIAWNVLEEYNLITKKEKVV
jgi:hypothetical protein